jgi:hypothetical protein
MSGEHAAHYVFHRGPLAGRRMDRLPLLALVDEWERLERHGALEWSDLRAQVALTTYLTSDGVWEAVQWAVAHGCEPCACCA